VSPAHSCKKNVGYSITRHFVTYYMTPRIATMGWACNTGGRSRKIDSSFIQGDSLNCTGHVVSNYDSSRGFLGYYAI
jgi:hypothetical protein